MAPTILERAGAVGGNAGGARRFARGQRKPGTLNKTEEAYAAYLRECQIAGEIDWFAFEGIKLRLADLTFYTPDFFVMTASGELECHEVKGFWEDDARVKIKVAAALFPFRFRAVTRVAKKDGGGWKTEFF